MNFKLVSVYLGLSVCAAMSVEVATACPDQNTVKAAVEKSFAGGPPVTVKNIAPSAMPELCDVVVESQGQKRIVYTDTKGKYLIAGQLFSSDGKNLTKEAISELNKFTAQDMQKLAELTAFTVGNKGPVVYFVTDPQCPYCNKGKDIIFPMAKAGEVQVKVLFYPLPFHKGAKEECISVICDNKGEEGMASRYRSENQCEAGKKKVEDAVSFLTSKGITGTPAYIFSDGKPNIGFLDQAPLKEKLVGK